MGARSRHSCRDSGLGTRHSAFPAATPLPSHGTPLKFNSIGQRRIGASPVFFSLVRRLLWYVGKEKTRSS